MNPEPLFAAYPGLAGRLPRLPLASLPTPLEPAPALADEGGAAEALIKRDDLSAAEYGGNKIRKLEFLIAEARARGARTILTFGAAGSNHALATALQARAHGLRCVSVLVPQPRTHGVRRNLRYASLAGAELHYCSSKAAAAARALALAARIRLRDGVNPMIIPPGGSSPVGAIGFVNAAFELKEQLAAGGHAPPDRIYVACGTMGTAIGLLIGALAAGLPSVIEAVRVVEDRFVNLRRGRRLFKSTVARLRRADPAFPALEFPGDRFHLEDAFFGGEYARHTEASVAAAAWARERLGLKLEGTYTGKAFAAMLADLRAGKRAGQALVFWNTYNSQPFPDAAREIAYTDLPGALHPYFTEPVQPLDQDSGP